MPPATYVPVNPSVVAWAFEESGLELDVVARRASAQPDDVRAWMSGAERPTKTQFSKLAEVLRKPTSVFFLPKPPDSYGRSVSLRSAAGGEPRALLTEERRSIARVASLQRLLRWLATAPEAGPVPKQLTESSAPPEAAADFRAALAIPVTEQRAWAHNTSAWRAWRAAVEDYGIFVFQEELGRSGVRGFSLPDDAVPIVAVNSAYAAAARTFSLFHEVGHILSRHGSACAGFVRPSGAGDPEERWCEEFAAAFLLPEDAFGAFLTQRFGAPHMSSVEQVRAAAGAFNVSARATALRAIRLGWAPADLYAQVEALWQVVDFPQPGGGTGERRPARRIRELGVRPPSIVLSAVRDGQLTELDAMRHLRIDSHDYDELRQLLQSA